MHGWLFVLVLALSGLALVGTGVLLVRDRLAGDVFFALLAVLELALLLQVVLGLVQLAGTEREVAGVVFTSYLLTLPLVLPIGAFWSLAERSRAGTAVLLVAALTVAGLEVRLDSIWGAGG